jgi:hypothetical protein
MNPILPQESRVTLDFETINAHYVSYRETLESILGLFLQGQGNSVPHHCQTKSSSAISRFLNHYKWSTRSLIRMVRSCILNLILSSYFTSISFESVRDS